MNKRMAESILIKPDRADRLTWFGYDLVIPIQPLSEHEFTSKRVV